MQTFQVYDSFTNMTVLLESASKKCTIVRYIPEIPQLDESGKYQPVTETVEVQYKDSAYARSDLFVLNRAFENAKAQARQTFRRGRVVLQAQFLSSTSLVESRIIAGAARFTKFTNSEQILQVVFTRVPYFQDVNETSIPCGGTTAGLTIRNYHSGGNINHFALDTTYIGGELPTQIRWEVTVNTLGAGEVVGTAFIGVFRGISGSTPLMYEGEAGTLHASGSGSNQAVSGAAGGSVKRTQVLSFVDANGVIPITSWNILNWTVSASDVSALNGRSVKPLVRISGTPPSDVQMWIASNSAGSAYASISDYVSINTITDAGNIVELPSIQVPPRSVLSTGADTAAAVTLSLYARKMSTGAANIDIDFLQLMPTDCHRKLLPDCPSASSINDDPYLEYQYIRTGGGARTPCVAYGAPTEVMPGETVYATISTRAISTTNFDTRTLTVKAFAKSRRLSL